MQIEVDRGAKQAFDQFQIADANGDFVTVALSTKQHHSNCLELKASDLANGRFTQPSYVRADKLYSVNSQAVQAKMGVAKPDLLVRASSLRRGKKPH